MAKCVFGCSRNSNRSVITLIRSACAGRPQQPEIMSGAFSPSMSCLWWQEQKVFRAKRFHPRDYLILNSFAKACHRGVHHSTCLLVIKLRLWKRIVSDSRNSTCCYVGGLE